MDEEEIKEVDAVVNLYALDQLRLRFSDPAIERRFEDESLLTSLHFIRAYVVGGILIYIAFGVLDFITGDPALRWMWFLRYGVVCPILVGILVVSFFPLFRRISQPLLSLAMLSSGLSIVAMTAIMAPPFNRLYFVGIIIVVSYCGNLIRLRFINSTFCALFLFIAYQLICVTVAPMPWRNFVANDFFLGSATLVGMLASYIQELYFRRSYIAHKIVEAKNRLTARLLVESQKANRAKNEFLANMSHELRTPLNAVIGFSDIIKAELHGPVGDRRYIDYAGDINASGQHLLAIINDILNLSKAEAGKLALNESRFSLTAVICECTRICSPDAEKRNVEVELHPDIANIVLFGDERLFVQIFLNLISNGIKFTPMGGRVAITSWIEPSGGVIAEVSDTGVGISPEDLDRVIRPFEQASSTYNRSTGGTGLGLSITKRFVELHGGTLTLWSEQHKGTTVRIALPPSRLAPPDRTDAADTGKTVTPPAAKAYG